MVERRKGVIRGDIHNARGKSKLLTAYTLDKQWIQLTVNGL